MNLGVGIPTLVSNYLEGRDVTLHAENGILGYGRMVSDERDIDLDIYNAAGQFVALHAGRLVLRQRDLVRDGARRPDRHRVLGAYEVDQPGNVANLSTGDARRGGIGGAMDLRRRQARADHRDGALRQQGPPEAAASVHVPADGQGLRELRGDRPGAAALGDGRFVLEEVAPGFTPQEVLALTEMDVTVGSAVRTMQGG